MNRLVEWIPRLAGRRVAVVGDVCLDEYLVGRAARLSREAPVPILEFQRRFTVPGAAANPALNLRALGATTYLISAVGDDEAGQELRLQLAGAGIDLTGIVVEPGRATTVKTRVMAEVSLRFPQQIVRLDRQTASPLAPASRQKLVARLREVVSRGQVDAILLSDYKGGVIAPELVEAGREVAREAERPLTVDSQGDLLKFRGFSVVKANQQEAELVLRRRLADHQAIIRAARALRRKLEAEAMLITCGGDGMALADAGDACVHIPATNRSEVYDTTGAGDTVIAVLTLALAAGAPLLEAAHLANFAAGIVVRRLGNATPTPDELKTAILTTDDRRPTTDDGRPMTDDG